jgi:alkanesulfonate monooxygenase SsuD/methylene tetrahydromethanopterin reductase-like flavin-dependent oxidoreductase (luciferase family)
VSLPSSGPGDPAALVPLARRAEDLGLDSVWVGDHLVARFPLVDSTVVLSAAAGATTRIGLGFGVMVAALRPAAWIAKQVASLQLLSGGRVLLGVGLGNEVHGDAGWRAAGVPFTERARRTDAILDVLPGLIRGEPTGLGGGNVTLAPGAPVPPILVGGGSDAALRRAARYADEWYAAFTPHGRLAGSRAHLAELAEGFGRPAPGITLGVSVGLGDVDRTALEAHVRSMTAYGVTEEAARRMVVTGPPAAAAERFAALAEAGVDRLNARPFPADHERQYELVAEAAALMAA